MSNREHIINELKKISPVVANLSENNMYSVPTDYFNNLSGEVFSFIKRESLLKEAKLNTYCTPNGYFTNLDEKIREKIFESISKKQTAKKELEDIAPVLSSLKNENVFTIPENYFAALTVTKPVKKQAKIIQLFSIKRLAIYAVASAFIAVLGFGALKYSSTNNTVQDVQKELAKSSDDELNNYLQNTTNVEYAYNISSSDEEAQSDLFEGATTEELNSFLNQQAETAENAKQGS